MLPQTCVLKHLPPSNTVAMVNTLNMGVKAMSPNNHEGKTLKVSLSVMETRLTQVCIFTEFSSLLSGVSEAGHPSFFLLLLVSFNSCFAITINLRAVCLHLKANSLQLSWETRPLQSRSSAEDICHNESPARCQREQPRTGSRRLGQTLSGRHIGEGGNVGTGSWDLGKPNHESSV